MLRIEIINDGTGDEKVGFYEYAVFINNDCIAEGGIDFHLRANGWISLVDKVVRDARKQEVDALRLKG
jgi:hypothetical protein